MAFGVKKSGNGEGSNVDYKALNEYMVNTCKLEVGEGLAGKLSGIIDMGMQPQEDAAMEFKGDAAAEAAEMEKSPDTYFEDMIDYQDGRKEKRYKRWPVKNAQTVGLTIDFSEIMLNKGQFFGDDDGQDHPLRMIMGGTFQQKFSQTYPLNVRKNEKTNNQWSMPHNSMLYKMAVDAKLVVKGSPFLPEQIDQLLAKSFQFKVTIGMKGEYLNEKIQYMGPLARGMAEPVLEDKYLYMIQFDEENDEAALKQLSNAAINTMKLSPDYVDSLVGKQLAALKGEAAPAPQTTAEKAPVATPNRGTEEPDFDDNDDDEPPF